MKRLSDFKLLTDENIHPDVVEWLRSQGYDVQDVREQNWSGSTDRFLMKVSSETGRVIITHDSDFGQIAIAQGESFTGIVYLRPGHIKPAFVIEMLKAVLSTEIISETPFIVVAQRYNDRVRIRVRGVEV